MPVFAEDIDASLNASARAYYSATGLEAFNTTYGWTPERPADTIPIAFTQPVLPTSLNPKVFHVTLNNGTVVVARSAAFLPNVEYNERQTIVIDGFWGNRQAPGTPGAIYPVQVDIVDDATNPLFMVGPNGLINAAGLTVKSKNPYVPGNGPMMVAAKLNVYTQLGEGSPLWCMQSIANSGSDLYGDDARFRIRIYTSAGFSPDGISSLFPTDYTKYFYLTAIDKNGKMVNITQTGVPYQVKGYGKITVVGLADCGAAQSSYNLAYVEDHDNQYDIILKGSPKAMAQIRYLTMPSSGDYSPVYNPGGPGNAPDTNPPVPFTVPSSYQEVEVTNDMDTLSYVTYVEVNGTVTKNAQGQPIGKSLGPAVVNKRTGYVISAYMDDKSRLFYASFPVQSC